MVFTIEGFFEVAIESIVIYIYIYIHISGFRNKIDNRFPVGNFITDGFSTPYRLDRDSNGGGIMLYVREYIPSK